MPRFVARAGLGLLSVGSVLVSVGCVGPTTPFGALAVVAIKADDIEKELPTTGQRTTHIRFSPQRQVLHGSSPFSIVIEDPEGVPSDYRLKISYNGLDVTRQFLRQAEVTELNPARTQLKLTTRAMRLLPTRDHQVKVAYWRERGTRPVIAQFQPPVCSYQAGNQMVLTLPEYHASLNVLQLINQDAAEKNLNPYFVAALVAQESSFDPKALSHSKALGLTQVTALGEAEVVKRFSNWPRYPGVNETSLPLIKLWILGERIHAGNEWRLDPALSIRGGVEYLAYLTEYWHRTDKRQQIERSLGPADAALSEVLLASYHSGASRVSDAMERLGPNWLQDEKLSEAQKYVRRVVSYCDYSEHRED